MLRRCQAVLLMLMLAVSSPIGWLGKSGRGHTKCNGTCCVKRLHPSLAQAAKVGLPGGDSICRRGTAGHLSVCLTKSHQATDLDVVAPLRPATLRQDGAMPDLNVSRLTTDETARTPQAGFVCPPFQPPRSL